MDPSASMAGALAVQDQHATQKAIERWDITDALAADIQQLSDIHQRLKERYSLSLGVSRGMNHIAIEFQAVGSQLAKSCDLLAGLSSLISLQRHIEQLHATTITPYTSAAGGWMVDMPDGNADTQALPAVAS